MKPSSVARLGLADQIAGTLEQRILNLEYQGGEKLVIDQLARELGVSSTPVRDALNRLSAARLVVFEPYIGFMVRPLPQLEEIRESYEARRCIETEATLLATPHMRAEDFAQLAALSREMAESEYTGSAESFILLTRANREFHRVIVARCRNRFLIEAWENLNHDELVAFTLHDRGVPDLEAIVLEHAAIVDALETKDQGRVSLAVTRHIVDGADRVYAGMMQGQSRDGDRAQR
jgi:DNA-binding GntR family transcriptional regulator